MRYALALLLTLSSSALAQQAPEPDPAAIERLLAHEQEILDAVKLRAPERYSELIALRDTDRRAYLRYLYRAARVLRQVGERDAASPELLNLRGQLDAVRARYPDGIEALSKKDQAAVRAELTTLASQLFDLKQAQRRERIDELRSSLEELEADVARRDAERDAILADFVEAFLRGRVEL
jgi:hypothetical protein